MGAEYCSVCWSNLALVGFSIAASEAQAIVDAERTSAASLNGVLRRGGRPKGKRPLAREDTRGPLGSTGRCLTALTESRTFR
jgi:hypothetical protein